MNHTRLNTDWKPSFCMRASVPFTPLDSSIKWYGTVWSIEVVEEAKIMWLNWWTSMQGESSSTKTFTRECQDPHENRQNYILSRRHSPSEMRDWSGSDVKTTQSSRIGHLARKDDSIWYIKKFQLGRMVIVVVFTPHNLYKTEPGEVCLNRNAHYPVPWQRSGHLMG